jgi:hypothetical protein
MSLRKIYVGKTLIAIALTTSLVVWSTIAAAQSLVERKCILTGGQLYILRTTPPVGDNLFLPFRPRAANVVGIRIKIKDPQTSFPIDGSVLTPARSSEITKTYQISSTTVITDSIVNSNQYFLVGPDGGIAYTQVFTTALSNGKTTGAFTTTSAVTDTLSIIDCKDVDLILDGTDNGGQFEYMLDYLKQ